MLALEVRHDYTFVHPEVLEGKCSIKDGIIQLKNEVNWESYRVFIIPGSKAISVETLRKVKDFYDQGGQVIGTTCLPDQSSELGRNAEVKSSREKFFRQPKACREIVAVGGQFSSRSHRPGC